MSIPLHVRVAIGEAIEAIEAARSILENDSDRPYEDVHAEAYEAIGRAEEALKRRRP